MPSPAELVRPFVGGTVLVWFLLALAVLPAWALGWAPTKGRSKPAA
jgi:hypothetical protein